MASPASASDDTDDLEDISSSDYDDIMSILLMASMVRATMPRTRRKTNFSLETRTWFESLDDKTKISYYDLKLKFRERYVDCPDPQPSFESDLTAYQEQIARMTNMFYQDIPDWHNWLRHTEKLAKAISQAQVS
ncbi:uncharacterized protein UTRI_05079_B [Ustilago trichophora]|uniref:Uncharacterized protein n=1 Tax=Ustilago trichophora TaxID=86804 RepID=A0A5C3EI18_9BASI|nr:uncharacterized protein UTRI_05079_B [Ustilago trichophora]